MVGQTGIMHVVERDVFLSAASCKKLTVYGTVGTQKQLVGEYKSSLNESSGTLQIYSSLRKALAEKEV